MGFFWFIEPWRALLGKERSSAKTGECARCVNLRQFFLAWGEANPTHSRDAARFGGILWRGDRYMEGYKTLADLEQATDAELLKLKGIGPYALRLIRQIGNSYED